MSAKRMQTRSVAFGGVICGLAVAVMLLSGVFPTAEFSLPAIAGILMIAMVIEYGYKQALLCYLAAAVLCLLLVPNKEAATLFAAFFGYYPILKGLLERVRRRWLEWILKLLVFNAAFIAAYLVVIYLFGLTQVLEELQPFGKWGIPLFLLAGNAVFVLFDVLLTRLIGLYYARIKPRFLDRLNLH